MSENKDSKTDDQEAIPIATLPIQALNKLKKQVEDQYKWYVSNRDTLKIAKQRYQGAGDALDVFVDTNNDKETLIPLTDSLYVPGKIKTSKVLVDIGVGYYAERTPKQAKGYYDRKVKFVEQRIKDVQKKIDETENSLQQIQGVFQQKLNDQINKTTNNDNNNNNSNVNDSDAIKSLKSSGILD
mmetsp:Transcript_9198/g.11502  ORF Transcript_9198/g.11502 Transcript_9198/m.11502 type:complete len:184 (+) Transcript_9198:136-687(+)